MANPRVGIDLDGVLADFNTPYRDLILKHTGVELPPISNTYPDGWLTGETMGLTKYQEALIWEDITTNPTFWSSLPVLEDSFPHWKDFVDWYDSEEVQARLETTGGVDLYFITHRMGLFCKEQSEDWLADQLGVSVPTVIVTGQKGLVAQALNLTHFVDDKVENCRDVVRDSPHTACYLLDRPWNRHTLVPGATRIYSMEAFFSDITRAALRGAYV